MKLFIGITAEPEYAKHLIKDLCRQYNLTLLQGPPIIIIPAENKAMFFAECSNIYDVDLLESDLAIDAIGCEPEFHTMDADLPIDTVSGDVAAVEQLERLLKKDAEI